MGFAERYIRALGASNLRDDGRHHRTEPLIAAAFASAELSGDIGALLHRVKFADAPACPAFASNPGNLAQLLRLWTAEVIKRGRRRKWVPENTAWDAQAAQTLYRTVAQASLAHWLDSTCKCCNGTGLAQGQPCRPCDGKGEAAIEASGGFVLERVKDMVSELHNIANSHAGRASARLR